MPENNVPGYSPEIIDSLNMRDSFSLTGPHKDFEDTDGNVPAFSQEELEQIKQQALQNVNNLQIGNNPQYTPEQKAALDRLEQLEKLKNGEMSSDYEQKVPARMHNWICYDEATKNNEKLRKESEEYMQKTVGNKSVEDILDEGNYKDRLSQFDLGDISDYLEYLKGLSLFEAINLRKRIDEEYTRWKSCKNMIKAVRDLRLEDNQNRDLMLINTLNKYDFSETADQFDAVYESNMEKFEQMIKVLQEIIDKNQTQSTQFLTNELIHLIDSKSENLPEDATNREFILKKMEVIRAAFADRTDLTYLDNKYTTFLEVNKKRIRKEFKDSAKTIQSRRRTKYINDLVRLFSEKIAYGYYAEIMKCFHDDTDCVYLFTYFLMKVMQNDKQNGKNTWVKVLIMNLSDIHAGIYDIGDGSGYEDKISNTFYGVTKDFINKNKISLNCYGTSFGLTSYTVENKTEDIPQTPEVVEETTTEE